MCEGEGVIRAAAYCRVSTDREDQANSFESQRRYFTEYIGRQPAWELYEVYADEGITGTSTRKRAAFNRMIDDARQGRFRLILTKEVSRFSRNILDTIAYTRELKALGVGVLFMNDGISTLEPDAELRLSIMASIAQEESRKTSSRVKWGQTRQMERGVVFGRSMLGYEVKDGRMTVEPEGAALVRLIFHKYGVEKKGVTVIARELREAGWRTCRGSPDWSGSHIVKILKNEKYAGDLVQKKTYTPDYLSHAKKYNHGEEALVVIRDHHEAIIDRTLWDSVQAELQRRRRRGGDGGGSTRYALSGKIRCGECGAAFVARKRYRKDGSCCLRWGCRAAVSGGTKRFDAEGRAVGCGVGWLLRDDEAMALLRQTLQALPVDREALLRAVTALALEAMEAGEPEDGRAEELTREISRLTRKKEAMLDAFFSGSITAGEMSALRERYDGELRALQQRRAALLGEGGAEGTARQEELRRHVADIVACRTESEAFYKTLLERITVCRGGLVELRLCDLPQTWVYRLEGRRRKEPPAGV
ncbi:MAG: recombinase family protein [Oscillospiraceae bacterium]